MTLTNQPCILEMVSVAGALEYSHRGEFNEALAVIEAALEGELPSNDRCEALVTKATILVDLDRPTDGLKVLQQACPDDATPLVKGKYYGTRAFIYSRLRQIDRALIDYEGAYAHFEAADHDGYRAAVKTNVAKLYAEAGDFDKAHKNLDLSRSTYVQLGDNSRLGKTEDQRAFIYLKQGLLDRAERSARSAVAVLSSSERVTWLAEARTTLGAILARRGRITDASQEFAAAIKICEHVESKESAALTYLTMIEELPLAWGETVSLYPKAHNYSDKARVLRAREKLINKLQESYEIDRVKIALQKHDGSVTKAATDLGLKTHGWVIKLIEKHPELSSYRKPKRKKTIIRK